MGQLYARLYWFWNPSPATQEFMLEVLGHFSEKQPEVFLIILRDNLNPRGPRKGEHMSYCATTSFLMGYAFGVETNEEEREHLLKRKQLYMNINRPDLLEVRNEMVQCIDNSLHYYENE